MNNGIKALGHEFHTYGSEEMACHYCDFVIWTVKTPEEAEKAVRLIGGDKCPAHNDD